MQVAYRDVSWREVLFQRQLSCKRSNMALVKGLTNRRSHPHPPPLQMQETLQLCSIASEIYSDVPSCRGV